jgi:hypothetical protein
MKTVYDNLLKLSKTALFFDANGGLSVAAIFAHREHRGAMNIICIASFGSNEDLSNLHF